jgi:PAS domain S-box-containing protein
MRSDSIHISQQAGAAGTGLIRGNVAQWLVFLNGLVLTIGAYFVLNYFVSQSIQDDYQRAAQSTARAVGQRLSESESAMRTVSALASMMNVPGDKAAQERLVYAVPHIDRLGSLLLFQRTQAGWKVDTLYTNAAAKLPVLAPDQGQALGGALLAGLSERSDISVGINLPSASFVKDEEDTDISSRPFALVRALRAANGEVNAMLVGLVNPAALLDSAWLASEPSLLHVTVRDQATGMPLYVMSRDGRPMGAGGPMVTLPVADASWQVSVDLSEYSGAAILKHIPLMLVLFGGSLTLICTLYIRSNHQQSLKLGAMNRILAKKNYELNSEITERERLNEVLRAAEKEYRSIVDSVSDVIFEASPDGEIVFLNSAWERITGFDVSHSLQRSLFDMLHQQDQEETIQNFKDLVRGKRGSYRGFARLRTRDGSFRSVEMAISMLRHDESKKLRVVGSFIDVEERRRAERALSEAEKKYRAIVENAAGGIFQMTPEGQILSANPAMARILGFETPERLLRDVRNAFDYLFSVSRDRSRFLRELNSNMIVNNMEVQGKARGGDKTWLNINARAVKDNEDNVLYFEGSLENITQRKDAEILLREAKIQSDLASRAKSEFLANMSHELRTPLNAIIGFSEIIKNEVLGVVANRQYWEYSTDIYNSGKKLLAIINEILDVSRIDAGDRQLNEASVDLTRLSAECVSFMSARVREGGLKMTNLIEGQVPPIIGEELAIKQILLNLMSNAVKFTPEGGRVTLSYEVDGDGQMLLSVTDTGIGLDETEIEKALSPFGQVDSTLSRAGSGAGLGLTLVDSLIKLHSGRLELFSQKGIGTTATVVFPSKRVGQGTTESRSSGLGLPYGGLGDRSPSGKMQ